jgi:hypothetical protein
MFPRLKKFGPFHTLLKSSPLVRFSSLSGWVSVLWACAGMVLFGVAGCSSGEKDALTREQMWEWVGQNVPVGMPLDAAALVMSKAGFECTRLVKASAKIIDIHKNPTVGTFDLLKCDREDGQPPIKRHWEVSLVHEGGKVKSIGVRFRDVYPDNHGAAASPSP